MFFILIMQALVFGSFDPVAAKDSNLIEKNFPLKGEISSLSGGKSRDRLYVAHFGKSKCVIRIMAEANAKSFAKQVSYSELAAQNQLGPSVLHYNLEDGILITEFIEGAPLAPRLLDDEDVLLQFSKALHRIHHCKSLMEDAYDPFECFERQLKQHSFERYLKHTQRIKSALQSRNLKAKTCHNDIHMMNVFYDRNKNIQFIDWGDAALGDPFFDLARASIEFHLSQDQTEKFLNTYFSGKISASDRAHFVLMQQIALLKIGLYFLDLSHLDEMTKDLVVSYLKKNEIEVDSNRINRPMDAAKIIFHLFESKMLSEETEQALFTLLSL